jgi:hypothetical protein
MQLLVHSDGQTAHAMADVAAGWRRLTNTFGFCEECRLEVNDDKVFRVQASIRAWPNIFGVRLAQYPKDVYGLLKPDWGRVELKAHELDIAVNLPMVRLQRLPRSGLPGVYQQPIEMDRQGRIAFWFSVLILFSNSTNTEYPDITEWDTQFLMGGRPGSSRRH